MLKLKIKIEKFEFFFFILFVFSISVNEHLMLYSLSVWSLVFILNLFLYRKIGSVKINFNKIDFLLLFLYFLSISITYFYSENKEEAFNQISQRVSILLFSGIGLIGIDNKYFDFEIIIKAFFYGTLVSVLIIIFKAFFGLFISANNLVEFINAPLMFFQNILGDFRHRTYWGISALFSIGIAFHISKTSKSVKLRTGLFLSIIILSAFIIFSEARSVLIGLIVIFAFQIYVYLKKTNNLLKFFLTILFILFALIVFQLPRFNKLHVGLKSNSTTILNSDPRIQIWLNTKELIFNNWVTGVGIGDAQNELDSYLLNKKTTENDIISLNAHNQYLQTILESGILSFTILLLLILSLFIKIKFNKKHASLMYLFIVIILICFFFESILNRLIGQLLLLFVMLLCSVNSNSKENMGRIISSIFRFEGIVMFYYSIIVVCIVLLGYLFKPRFNPFNPSTYATQPFEKYEISYDSAFENIDSNRTYMAVKYNSDFFNKNIEKTSGNYFLIYRGMINKRDTIIGNIYCKTSGLKNGICGLLLANDALGIETSYINSLFYNEWQKIQISSTNIEGVIMLSFFINPVNVEDSIKGEILLFYPEITIRNSTQ